MIYSPPRFYRFSMRLCAVTVTMFLLVQVLGVAANTSAPLANPAQQIETTTPIKHFVTVMQSNHSFDSLFGQYPNADGIPGDVCMQVDPGDPANEECVEPFALSNNGADLDHSHTTFERQYRDGQNDGFISAYRARGEDGTLAMGHYTEAELPFSYNAADNYVLFDRFFTSASAGSVPNRMYWTTGTAGIESFADSAIPDAGWGDLPTIFDLLEESGISWKFYIENYDPSLDFRNRGEGATYAQVNWAPILNYARYIDDPAYDDNIGHLDEYFTDVENGTLPAVSYVVTIGSSGHPPGSMIASERMLQRMVNSLMMSPLWSTSAIQWAYDDWGGWYDHVPPPQIDEFGYGFRTPAQLISPYAREGYVDSTILDFTSILAFIQDNWSLPSLSTRDRDANSIASAFDFDKPPRTASILLGSRMESEIVVPNRSVLHISYSIAIVSAAAVIGGAFIHGKLRKEDQP
jgi:phospholipase C